MKIILLIGVFLFLVSLVIWICLYRRLRKSKHESSRMHWLEAARLGHSIHVLREEKTALMDELKKVSLI
uniref:Envelope stress response membrane protein PspB n=1 Tax=Strongyloides papillosus TaxID=174720 RepID=A0A0N5B5V8_STREA